MSDTQKSEDVVRFSELAELFNQIHQERRSTERMTSTELKELFKQVQQDRKEVFTKQMTLNLDGGTF